MTKTDFRDRAWEVLPFGLCLFLACALLKYTYLRHGAAEAIATSLGPGSLSGMEYLRLFAAQSVESLVIFPLALLVAGYGIGARWRPWAYFACLELALCFALAGWITFFTLGRFPTREVTQEFINAYRVNPEFVTPKSTVAAGLAVKSALLLVLGLAPLLLLRWRGFRALLPFSRAVVVVPVLLVGAVGASLTATTPAGSIFHMGEVHRLLDEFAHAERMTLPPSTGLTARSVMEAYERVAFPAGRRPSVSEPPSCPAPAASPNVVFIVLETAALRDYDFTGQHPSMPRVAKLVPHSLVANRHFASDPYSLRANFSLYSSVYDLRGRKPFSRYVAGHPGARRLDSLPCLLRERGYTTRYYYTHPFWPDADSEEAQIDYLGFDEIYIYGFSRGDGRQPPERNVHAERAMFGQVCRDLADLHARGKPFFLAIANSIGHSPYFDIRPAGAVAADPSPRREILVGNIVALMDGLVGSVADTLAELGMLDDTILVVTGDHGLRSTVDDPRLDTRYANEESYNVPLLIHFPRAFAQPVVVNEVTSHLDVAPTVLRLMGMDTRRYLHQGTWMLDPSLADRATFFLGDHYTGCDGLHYGDRFFMVNGVARAVYASNRFLFDRENLLTGASTPEARRDRQFVDAAFAGLSEVQWSLISYLRAGSKPGAGMQEERHGIVRTFLAADDTGVPAPDRATHWK